MALIQLTCLMLVITLVKITESQCFGRNGYCNGCGSGGGVTRAYLPVVLTDQFPNSSTKTASCPTVSGQSSYNCLTDDELYALQRLAKVLESDKTACATKGIDVDRVLETLVAALVYTTTHTVEKSMNRCNIPTQNDANILGLLGQNGLIDKLLSAIVGGRQDSHSLAQGSQNGRSLVELDLGKDGLGLNVGGLIDANVGGKRSETDVSGTSATTTATSTSSSGLLDGVGRTVGGLL